MERRRSYTPEERQQLVESSLTVNSTHELQRNGLRVDQIYGLCNQVSDAINEYNLEHPAEMLPKSPETILDQLNNGLSALIYANNEDNDPMFLYHGTSYEMFEDGEELYLNAQILEFGSAIAHPDFRSGYGLGTQGAIARARLIDTYKNNGLDAFGLSTIKRAITGRVWSKALGAQAISFWEVPYLAFLTDTCSGSSERYGHKSCRYRRLPVDSDESSLSDAVSNNGNGAYMPCTLIVTDRDAAYRFDQRARALHNSLFGISIEPGDISVDSYSSIQFFFDSIKK